MNVHARSQVPTNSTNEGRERIRPARRFRKIPSLWSISKIQNRNNLAFCLARRRAKRETARTSKSSSTMIVPAGAKRRARKSACSRFAGLGGLSMRISRDCFSRATRSGRVSRSKDSIMRSRFQTRLSGSTVETSDPRFFTASTDSSVRFSQSNESSILVRPEAVWRRTWVERPEPNSNALLSGGNNLRTSPNNLQLNGGRIHSGMAVSRWIRAYSATTRASSFSSGRTLSSAGCSVVTVQSPFQ